MVRPSALKSSYMAAILLNFWAIEPPDDYSKVSLRELSANSPGFPKQS
jgi:hypothetical protein